MEEIIEHIKQSSDGEVLIIRMSDDITYLEESIANFGFYQAEYNLIKTEKRKLEFLNARMALNNLCKRTVNILYNEAGKPFIDDQSFHISISHSGKWMAVSIHPTLPTGVDVEQISDRVLKVCNKFLTEEEQKNIGDKNPKLNYLLAWSAKEALYKIIGNDAVDFRKQLSIFPFETDTEGKMKVHHIPADKYYNPEFKVFTDFVVVFCNG